MLNHAFNAAFGECTRLPDASFTARRTWQDPMPTNKATVAAGEAQIVRDAALQRKEAN